jgi:arylsulfatase A-like enzyme
VVAAALGMRGSRLVAGILALGIVAAGAERTWRPRVGDTHVAVSDVVRVLHEDPDGAQVAGQRPDAPVRVDGLQPSPYLDGDGGYRRALVTPAPATVRYRVTVPAAARLDFAVGAARDKGVPGRDAEPIRFAVRVDGEERFAREVNALRSRHDRRWFPASIDLRDVAGRTVDLELVTTTDGEPHATPGWSDVRLVTERWVKRQPASPETPSLLVLVVDTLRADRLGCYGADPSPSPNLDALCRRGLVMDEHVAQAPWTMPSVATILSGLHPRQHGVVGGSWDWGKPPGVDATADWAFLAHDIPTFLESASRAGLTTMAISTNPIVSRDTNMLRDLDAVEELPSTKDPTFWATAAEVNARFVDWLEDQREHRFLAYLHYMDVHGPYRPPDDLRPPAPDGIRKGVRRGNVDELRKRLRPNERLRPEELAYLRALYDAEIAAWDRELGRLLAALDEMGLLATTNVLVTADHGEEFQEHGLLGHTQLYDEVIRIPFVLAGPAVPQPLRVDVQSQGIDVFPTVAGLVGMPAPEGLPGTDVRSALLPRPAVSETRVVAGKDGHNQEILSIRTPEAKLLHTPATADYTFFDLTRDPGEQTPTPADTPPANVLKGALDAWRAATPEASRPSGQDPHLFEKLRELGYAQ